VAVLALLALTPLLLAIAVAVRPDSPGPVFYRDLRVGRRGRIFSIYKFRTVVHGAEYLGLGRDVAKNDVRITLAGSWLRRTSCDEIPQLINVAPRDRRRSSRQHATT